MTQRDGTVYLRPILETTERIEEYLDGVSEQRFRQNHLIQDGVIRQFEITGEAAKQLSPELCAAATALPTLKRLKERLACLLAARA